MVFTVRLVCLLVGMLLAGGVARADVISFTYTFSNGDVLGASLTGTLQADGNTFNVSGYNSVSYNGADVTFVPDYFQSFSDFYAGVEPSVSASGVLTLNGSYENFIDYSNLFGGFDLIVNAGDSYSAGPNIGVFGFSDLGDQPFVPASFSASVTGLPSMMAVPEPGTLALVGAGLLGLMALRRRRA